MRIQSLTTDKSPTIKQLGLLFTISFLSACAHYSPTTNSVDSFQSVNNEIIIPGSFESVTDKVNTNNKAAESLFSLDTNSLLNGFSNPKLQDLIQQGLDNNPNLAATATFVLDSQARARTAAGQRLPNLNLGVSAGRSKNNLGFTTFTANNYSLGLNSQWELDIWLKLRDQSKASLLELAASENDFVFAQLSLAANISRAYFNVLSEQELLAQTRQSTENIQQLESIAVRSFKRGLVTALDVQLARRDLANAKRSMTAQENTVRNSVRDLNTLVGSYPDSEKTMHSFSGLMLPSLNTSLQAGIPSSVLSQRPDLIAAETRLKAADLQLSVARKNLLPSISLTGSGGTSSTDLSDLLDKDFSVWSILSSLSMPLLNRQALKSNVDLAENSLDRLTYNYASQVLNAFNEVESGLDNEGSLRQQLTELTEARDYAQASSARAKQSYKKGLVEANTLLSTELQLRSAEQNLISTKNLLLQNRINLVLALGGGLKANAKNITQSNIDNAVTNSSAAGETL